MIRCFEYATLKNDVNVLNDVARYSVADRTKQSESIRECYLTRLKREKNRDRCYRSEQMENDVIYSIEQYDITRCAHIRSR